jgi:hypothetical protein
MRHLLFTAAYLLFSFAARADEAKPEIFAPNVISAPVMSTAPTFSPDQSAVIYQRGDEQHHVRLYEAHRAGDSWTAAQPLPFDLQWNYLEPAWSADGSYLIFASNRPADGGGAPLDGHWNGKIWAGRGGQLWRSDRTASGWSAPKPLPPGINTDSSIFEPALTRNGTLYFMQPDEDGKFHLMRAEKRGDGYAKPEPLPFAVKGTADVDPAVAPDDSYILFSSTRDTRTRLAIYISFHQNGTWSTPKMLPGPVNDGSSAMDLHLSPDEKTLYFLRDLVIWQVPVADLVKALR